MAEETVATMPADAGASPAPESVSTPAPDTSSATPSPAPTATPVAEFDASRFDRLPDEDPKAYLDRATKARAEAEKAKAEAAKPAEAKPAEAKPEVKVEPPKEEPKPETKVEPEKPAEDEDDPSAEPFSLDDLAPLPPKDLYAKLKENPDLDKKLTELGIKDQLFQGQRMAAKAIGYMEVFPGGVDDAKYAKTQAENFGAFDDLITSVKSDGLVAVDKIIGKLAEMDYVVDDAGNPVMDANGAPLMQGNTKAFIESLGELTWRARIQNLEQEASAAAKANPEDEEAQNILAAIEVLKTRGSKGSVPEEEMTPAMKAKAAELKAREEELARAQERDTEAQYQQREEKIAVQTDQSVNGEIESVLAKTDLPKEQWPLILREVRDKAADKLASDSLFKSKRDWIMRAQYNPNVEKQRIAHSVNSTKTVVLGTKGILAETLKQYGVKVMANQQARREKIDTQIAAQRSDPKGTSSLAPAPKPMSNDEIFEKAKEVLRSKAMDDEDSKLILRVVRDLRAQGM